jgi:FkbM family methyltransferase
MAERWLSKVTHGKGRGSLIWKLVPPEYLYKNPRIHRVTREEIVFDLDISNYNDYYLFYGLPEPSLLYLLSFIRADFTILDIGANIGFTTLNFARRCHQGFVHAYEPDLFNFDRLKQNISLNQFANISIVRKGLGEFPSAQEWKRLNPHHTGMNHIRREATEGNAVEKIDVVRLDDEVALRKVNEINLIKIDVEGYELNVVRGALDSIRKFKPILFIELIEKNLKQYNHLIREGPWDQTETDILCLPFD